MFGSGNGEEWSEMAVEGTVTVEKRAGKVKMVSDWLKLSGNEEENGHEMACKGQETCRNRSEMINKNGQMGFKCM